MFAATDVSGAGLQNANDGKLKHRIEVRILLTCFEAYGDWDDNSSWMSMAELLRGYTPKFELVTRRYPIDLAALSERLAADLEQPYDAILHLGQSPGAAAVKLESVAVNVAGRVEDAGLAMPALDPDGPVAYSSEMPVARWADLLLEAKIPAIVSYHAGTFLCNAIMYLSHRWHDRHQKQTPVGFVHLPLATEQVLDARRAVPSLPLATLSAALRIILDDFTTP